MFLKYFFALGFLFYLKKGVSLPGQRYLRLFEMEVRYKFMVRNRSDGFGVPASNLVRYLHWKSEFVLTHNMMSAELLGSDLDYITGLLRQRSETKKQDHGTHVEVYEEYTNAFIYEVLAYLQKTVLPLVSREIKFNALHYAQLPNLIGAIAHECK